MLWTSLGPLTKRCVQVSDSQEDYMNSKNIASIELGQALSNFPKTSRRVS